MNNSVLFHVSEQELMPTNSAYCHVSEIDTHKDDSIQEIVYQDLCDYFIAEDVPAILNKAYNKLISGGSLHIQGSDLRQVGIAIAFNMISEDVIKSVLYPNKKSIHNMSEILAILKDTGFKISVKKYINVFEYYIKAYK